MQYFSNIVSGWMGMIKSRSIIPHSPTDHEPPPTNHHSGVTGIDIKTQFLSPGLISINPPPGKSKSEVKIMKTIKNLHIIALTEDLEATHFETTQIIKLSFMTSRKSCDGI
jgi:hypothetical protein